MKYNQSGFNKLIYSINKINIKFIKNINYGKPKLIQST